MSPIVLYGAILAAALAHATWNSLVKSAADRLLMMAAIRFVGLLFGVAVLPFVSWPSDTGAKWLALACAANFGYHALLIRSYRVGDLSLIYPVARGSAPVLLALIAFVTVDERLVLAQIMAVLLIVGGILCLVIGRASDGRAVCLALATGLSIAAYSFFGALGVRVSESVLGFQAWLETLTGIGVLGYAAIRRRGQILVFVQASGPLGLFAGVLSVSGYMVFLLAAKVLPLAVISALRECSLIFGTLIGALLHKELFATRRIVAAALVVSGVIVLGLSVTR